MLGVSGEPPILFFQGVFLHFEQRDGGPQLVRIRFSRRRFSKAEAEAWYASNRARIAARYSQAILDVGLM